MDADEILKSEIPMEPERKSTQPPPSIIPELETDVADVRLEEDKQTGQQAGFQPYENIFKNGWNPVYC